MSCCAGGGEAFPSERPVLPSSKEELKVVILGAPGVGKTCLLCRYVRGSFLEGAVAPTVGAAFFSKVIERGTQMIELMLWDTAGQERYRSMVPSYYRGADIALLVYDSSNAETLGDVQSWLSELEQNLDALPKLILVGTKVDIKEEGVSSEVIERIAAKHNLSWVVETSAKTGSGMREFSMVLEDLCFSISSGRA